jgi:hypothetical protein
LKSNSLFVSSGRSDGLLLSKYLPPFALFEKMGYNNPGGTFQVVGYGLYNVLGVGLLQSDTANFPYAEPFFDTPECSFYHPTGFD